MPRVEKICAACGKPFTRGPKATTCSHECRLELSRRAQAIRRERLRTDPDAAERKRRRDRDYYAAKTEAARRAKAEWRRSQSEAELTIDLLRLQREAAEAGVKPCRRCGKPVVGRTAKAIYCSPECNSLAVQESQRLRATPTAPRTCEFCGATIDPATGFFRYCSPSCRESAATLRRIARWIGRLPERPCAVCGSMFRPDRGTGTICPSRECKRRAKTECRRRYELRRRKGKHDERTTPVPADDDDVGAGLRPDDR